MTAPTPFTKITVGLIPKAVVALDAAVAQTGGSRTDAINRAVQLYGAIVAAHSVGSAEFLVTDMHGGPMRIWINRPRWRFW